MIWRFRNWLRRWLGITTLNDLVSNRMEQKSLRLEIRELEEDLRRRLTALETAVRTLALKDAIRDSEAAERKERP